ncbi:histidine phosphatase family protein [Halomonas huangheensis]|uniref:Phosphoglycerate mutase n=1 Tax=Halomonas huangheensis TaxID=1178482 RepID=W1N747_9GAMM|nr:histidine phosphatase family protein [Halomonas huangheensis]ALM53072.1 phosphoglycerate mutase [Halomonas huangheensis]ERL51367.1 hypothetical protein BJB45_14340 [Halomonas huangheensis]
MADGMYLELVVVRHGLTQWNLDKRYQGQRDIELLLPDALPDMDRLRDELAGEHFDAVVSSDLKRCRQTLAHISEGRGWPEARRDERLRENDFGEFEGRSWEELKEHAIYRDWIDSAGEMAPPGGESAEQLRQRLHLALGDIFARAQAEQHRKVLVVTHGGVIRELRRVHDGVAFWDGVVGQAAGRRWVFIQQSGEWQCSSSLAVPAPASEIA